ncbi:hypothetical protein YC2023_111032 [Brassica napus]
MRRLEITLEGPKDRKKRLNTKKAIKRNQGWIRGEGVDVVRKPVAASYRRERRSHTLKHTVPTASDRPTCHNPHKESHLELACPPKKNHTGNTRRKQQPAMPSFGEGRLKITASNFPTRNRIHPFNQAPI